MVDTKPMRNALTIDVEDYFHVSAFSSRIDRGMWESLPGRVERDIDVILDILDQHHARATFFVLGWVAERYPSLVRRIVARRHELASHGYSHERATLQSRAVFSEDVTRAKRILEDISGVIVNGYRAPSFSIGAGNLWALDCLRKADYRYSSSVYPIRHDHYGMPDAPRFPFYPGPGDGLLELPVTTVRLCGTNVPAGGGGYFRLLPYRVSRWCLKHVNEHEHRPCIFYFHPWEIDSGQPRVNGIGAKTRFRHYVNIGCMERRVRALCADFRWDRVDRVFRLPETQAAVEAYA
jgi:polysaccharide deacetylase family protein (PEP-CTERM system associated)